MLRNSQDNDTFINKVIEIAKKEFVPGYLNNQNFIKIARNNSALRNEYNLGAHYASRKTTDFIGDVTRIPNTHFLAAAGPRMFSLENFIKDTVFHPKTPISEIIALGDCVAHDDFATQDFTDYFLKQEQECGSFHITINHKSGTILPATSGQILLKGIVDSKLTITQSDIQKNVNVTLFALRDNTSINLTDEADFELLCLSKTKKELLDERKEAFWKIFKKSQTEDVVVHCAAGVGRTGHFILTMLILENFAAIFAGNNPQLSAKKIANVLANIRNERLALVNTLDQYISAIRNADIIYRYALKKKYITAEDMKKEIITPISIFRATSISEEEPLQRALENQPNFGCRIV